MKYMQNGGFQSHPVMRLTLGLTLVLLAAFVVTNFFLYFARMDLTPASVVQYYNGSEAEYRPARSYQSMLEVSHGHFAMMAVVLLLLTHLVIFAPLAKRIRMVLIVGVFSAALLGEVAGWLVRFVDEGFALLKVASFVVLQTGLIVTILILAHFLWRGQNGGEEEKR